MRTPRSLVFLGVALGAIGALGCSVITSFSNLEGTSSDAGTDGSKSDGASISDGSTDATFDAGIDSSPNFPDGSSVFTGNGHAYMIVLTDDALTWEEASALATDAGGHLATLTTDDENDFALNLVINTSGSLIDTEGVWFGAYQPNPTAAEEPDGGWAWVTGEPWDFTAWAPGEPNNEGTENWGCFEYKDDTYGWNDIDDEGVYNYLVEFE